MPLKRAIEGVWIVMETRIELPNFMRDQFRPATGWEVRSWSFGLLKEILHPNTTETVGTLADQRIFGPLKDFHCGCGKYQGARYKSMICDRCGVKLTFSAPARQSRFGHIELATPIAHPLRETNEKLDAVPVLPATYIESVSGRRLASLYEDLVGFSRESSREGCEAAFGAVVGQLLPTLLLACEWNLVDSLTLARGMALERREGDRDRSIEEICNYCGYPLGGLDVSVCPGCGREKK